MISCGATPPDGPPNGGGGRLLFEESFEDANLSSRGWYDNTSVLLSTAEHVAGSASSAQYRFPAAATTPTHGSGQRHKFEATASVYVSYYLKYSANWVGSGRSYHPHELYILTNLDGDYAGPANTYMTAYLEHNYQNGGLPRLAIQDNKSINTSQGSLPNNLVGVTENRSTGGCNGIVETNVQTECYFNGSYWYNLKQVKGPVVFAPGPGPGYKNDWHFVEAFFRLNTVAGGVAQHDGVMQYWANGVLLIDRHDIQYRTANRPEMRFNQLLIGPYIGDGSPVDQSMFIDDLRVATERIP